MTASEASRNFSALLDSVEQGETVVVTRGGRRIAAITPAPAANGTALNKVIAKWHGSEALDDVFTESIAGARAAASTDKDADPWSE
ncbi:type II toxin-antitoxin system Phd/YefM family antitoxin [Mycolicibacterium sphagni]|uniref:type II toxin-antitoxin system Phd/YefM family antitoxin n=1 Tax=Mycolicibacterium sphagni TaxID=1786 RepID=UPI003D2FA564